jgi:hypothetical protein
VQSAVELTLIYLTSHLQRDDVSLVICWFISQRLYPTWPILKHS